MIIKKRDFRLLYFKMKFNMKLKITTIKMKVYKDHKDYKENNYITQWIIARSILTLILIRLR